MPTPIRISIPALQSRLKAATGRSWAASTIADARNWGRGSRALLDALERVTGEILREAVKTQKKETRK